MVLEGTAEGGGWGGGPGGTGPSAGPPHRVQAHLTLPLTSFLFQSQYLLLKVFQREKSKTPSLSILSPCELWGTELICIVLSSHFRKQSSPLRPPKKRLGGSSALPIFLNSLQCYWSLHQCLCLPTRSLKTVCCSSYITNHHLRFFAMSDVEKYLKFKIQKSNKNQPFLLKGFCPSGQTSKNRSITSLFTER